MNICIFGNSHAACLKNGWEMIKNDHPEVRLHFFASRQNGLSGLKLKGNSLVPRSLRLQKDISFTSGGKKTVPLQEFDFFLLFGLGLNIPTLDRRLSHAVVQQTCTDNFNRALSTRIARLIRTSSKAPIFLGHNPQHAIDYMDSRENKLNYQETITLMKSGCIIENCELLEQPESTLADNQWNTKAKFSCGSTRLDVGDKISGQTHAEDDRTHMNAEFGKVYISTFLGRIS